MAKELPLLLLRTIVAVVCRRPIPVLRGSGRSARRLKVENRLIRSSLMFDAEWYLRTYPDVAKAAVDPLIHFVTTGWRERRDPGPEFSTSGYLKTNPDVAEAGVNPLLHFLEFGNFEGRVSSAHYGGRQPAAVSAKFGPAAPCISLPLLHDRRTRWRRSCQLDRGRQDLFLASDCAVGYAADPGTRTALRKAFALLGKLSGYGRGTSAAKETSLPQSAEELLDSWFVNMGQLRTRWHCENFPVVARAYQRDPLRSGALVEVGEAILTSSLDVLDAHVRNRFFPLLLIFAEPEGRIRGAKMLVFPSLCRGGIHYPELLCSAAAPGAAVNPMTVGELLGHRLLRLLHGGKPSISQIKVEVTGGDGRGPLFQADGQLWLRRVLQIGVEPIINANSSRADQYLAKTVALRSSRLRIPGEATLMIAGNMIPTIAALTELYQLGDDGPDEIAVPFIIAPPDPSRPAFLMEFPREMTLGMVELQVCGAAWPRLRRGLNGRLPRMIVSAAIAQPKTKSVTNAELLVPRVRLPSSDCADGRAAVTWLIEASGWPKQGLACAVHALSLQAGGGADSLTFLGVPDTVSLSTARERFAGRIKVIVDTETAVAATSTPLIGYVGAGIILHENCATLELASLLSNDAIATASCVVVNARQSAAAFHVLIADGGALATPSGTTLEWREYQDVIAHLMGINYPVAAPTREFWLAQRSCVEQWITAPEAELGSRFHVCCSSVTVAQISPRSERVLPSFVPCAPKSRVARVQAFSG
jgi:hypothetical protein